MAAQSEPGDTEEAPQLRGTHLFSLVNNLTALAAPGISTHSVFYNNMFGREREWERGRGGERFILKQLTKLQLNLDS